MRIAQIAPTYERVPPRAYGGTELIVGLITDELVARGHEVTLFASGDSITSAKLRSVTPTPVRYGDRSNGGPNHAEYLQLANVQAAFLAAADGAFDVVHSHAGIEGLVLGATSRTPVVSTMHNPFVPETQPIWDAYPWFHHAVSAASAVTFPRPGALSAILHGIDVASFEARTEPRREADRYLLFLGRFSPAKGADRAIEAARRAGCRLILAGKIDAADAEHVRTAIEPFLDGDRVRYVGEVDGVTKRTLLAGADGLLFPIEWDEPFGLVMVEALASGTPVVGFRRASVPEVVDDGLTGFVVDDLDGMVEAIGRLARIDRSTCRRVAAERFTVERMVDEVEAMYCAVLDEATAGLMPGIALAAASTVGRQAPR